MYYSTEYLSPLGLLTLASDGKSIVGLWIEGQKYHGQPINSQMTPLDGLPVLAAARDWLDRYFAGKKPSALELPLAPVGSDFQKTIWTLLRKITYGEHTTYLALAKTAAALGGKSAAPTRAVGTAIGRNPISIIIPCHRVVGSNGSLTGYAGGLDKKFWLLKHEGADMTGLFMPAASTAP